MIAGMLGMLPASGWRVLRALRRLDAV